MRAKGIDPDTATPEQWAAHKGAYKAQKETEKAGRLKIGQDTYKRHRGEKIEGMSDEAKARFEAGTATEDDIIAMNKSLRAASEKRNEADEDARIEKRRRELERRGKWLALKKQRLQQDSDIEEAQYRRDHPTYSSGAGQAASGFGAGVQEGFTLRFKPGSLHQLMEDADLNAIGRDWDFLSQKAKNAFDWTAGISKDVYGWADTQTGGKLSGGIGAVTDFAKSYIEPYAKKLAPYAKLAAITAAMPPSVVMSAIPGFLGKQGFDKQSQLAYAQHHEKLLSAIGSSKLNVLNYIPGMGKLASIYGPAAKETTVNLMGRALLDPRFDVSLNQQEIQRRVQRPAPTPTS